MKPYGTLMTIIIGATKKEVLVSNNITHVLTLLDSGDQPHFPNASKIIIDNNNNYYYY